MPKPDALLLLGPTASGKTAYALEIARFFPIEIISIDSALVYRKMDIGTAKPTQEERRRVPHHLIDIIEPTDSYSAADFKNDCENLIRQIRKKGKIPFIVGGTMLYAKALTQGLNELPPTNDQIRDKVKRILDREGLVALYERLKRVDPISAARLKAGDTQRITRALEVYEMTGKPLSSFYAPPEKPFFNYQSFALLPPDRSVLHKRIEYRFDQMLEAGFVHEVEQLRKIPGIREDLPSMRCVGYRQAWHYLDGEISYSHFRESGIVATRQLAKRQITWLRAMHETAKLDPDNKETIEELKKAAEAAL